MCRRGVGLVLARASKGLIVESQERRVHLWTDILQHIGLFLVGVAMIVLVVWLATSEQKTKLYESDNVVCASQPFAIACFERKPR